MPQLKPRYIITQSQALRIRKAIYAGNDKLAVSLVLELMDNRCIGYSDKIIEEDVKYLTQALSQRLEKEAGIINRAKEKRPIE